MVCKICGTKQSRNGDFGEVCEPCKSKLENNKPLPTEKCQRCGIKKDQIDTTPYGRLCRLCKSKIKPPDKCPLCLRSSNVIKVWYWHDQIGKICKNCTRNIRKITVPGPGQQDEQCANCETILSVSKRKIKNSAQRVWDTDLGKMCNACGYCYTSTGNVRILHTKSKRKVKPVKRTLVKGICHNCGRPAIINQSRKGEKKGWLCGRCTSYATKLKKARPSFLGRMTKQDQEYNPILSPSDLHNQRENLKRLESAVKKGKDPLTVPWIDVNQGELSEADSDIGTDHSATNQDEENDVDKNSGDDDGLDEEGFLRTGAFRDNVDLAMINITPSDMNAWAWGHARDVVLDYYRTRMEPADTERFTTFLQYIGLNDVDPHTEDRMEIAKICATRRQECKAREEKSE